MASTVFYPPIVKDYEPAFVAGNDSVLRIYFNLSSLSGSMPSEDQWWVHAHIIRKDGVLVTYTVDNGTRLRKTGTILNLVPQSTGKVGYYYIELLNEDLKTTGTFYDIVDKENKEYHGFIPGDIYKVQIRLSMRQCTGDDVTYQDAWMQREAVNFTEWSTICFVKAIGPMHQEFSLDDNYFSGLIENKIPNSNEDYYYTNIKLIDMDENPNIIKENSGNLYNTGIDKNRFHYTFKTKFIVGHEYKVLWNYVTENDYYKEMPEYTFTYQVDPKDANGYRITTVEENLHTTIGEKLNKYTSIAQEEDEGRVALKVYYIPQEITINNETTTETTLPNKGSFYILRSNSKDNFATWEIIKFIKVKGSVTEDEPTIEDINNSDIIYDYTIESGVWYKYAVQAYNEDDDSYMAINEANIFILRNFDFAFLLGFGEQQLKLEFDHSVSNYSTKVSESQLEAIGSKYPYFNRSNKIYYKTFSITGLISFNMDEQNTFLKEGKLSIYKYPDVVTLYNNYNQQHRIDKKDYIYERDFRNKVMEFLYRDKPLLYKSPTEGNIVLRLNNISLNPNQTLGRLVYSFNANVSEIDDNTLEVYKKYGFYEPDMKIGTNFNAPMEEDWDWNWPVETNTPTY